MHYTGPVIRPPYEAGSVMLEVTVGCTHDSCTFCTYYKGHPFRPAPLEQVRADLAEIARFRPGTDHIWAAGGDPFSMSARRLLELAALVHEYLPGATISTYARVDSMRNKSVEDLRALHDAGYTDIMIGIESGDDEVLAHVNKGYTAADVVEQCGKLDEAGLPYNCIYLGGIAGAGRAEETAARSAEVFNQIHPRFMYLTTVTIFPDSELGAEVARGDFAPMSELERFREFRALVAALENPIVVDTRLVTNSIGLRRRAAGRPQGVPGRARRGHRRLLGGRRAEALAQEGDDAHDLTPEIVTERLRFNVRCLSHHPWYCQGRVRRPVAGPRCATSPMRDDRSEENGRMQDRRRQLVSEMLS